MTRNQMIDLLTRALWNVEEVQNFAGEEDRFLHGYLAATWNAVNDAIEAVKTQKEV